MKAVLPGLLLIAVAGASVASDYEHTVDCADSWEIDCLHDGSDEPTVIYDPDSGEFFPDGGEDKPKTVYEEDLSSSAADNDQAASAQPAAGNASAATQAPEQAQHHAGKEFIIRERYTLDMAKSPPLYNAASVVNALNQQMARYCSQGWTKTKEWTTPVDGDFFLHYQFTCRDVE